MGLHRSGMHRYECERCRAAGKPNVYGTAHYLSELQPDGTIVNVLVCTECFERSKKKAVAA